MTDLRYVLRSLTRARWFTIGSMLTFALGIGVNVVMFAAVDRMLFRSLPYRDAGSLVTLQLCSPRGCDGAFPANVAYQLKTASRTIDDVGTIFAAFLARFSQVPDDEHPIELMEASPNLLRMLGVQPVIGRLASPDEEGGRERFGWLAYDTWRNKLNADPSVVGRRIGFGERVVTVLGVLPKSFIPPVLFGSVARWEGIVTARKGWADIKADGTGSVAAPIARLKAGVSIGDARSEAVALMMALHADRGVATIDVQPIETGLFARYRQQLLMVSVPSLLILALACVNVGALLLLRSRSGEHITAVRLAMGATRGRIIKTALLESTMICLGGAVVGVLVLGVAGRLAKVYVPALFVRNADSLFDMRVLSVAFATVIASAFIAGLLPAWRLTRADVRTLLSQSPRRAGRLRGGRFVLGVESAIGCVLVLGAFFTVRSLVKLTTEDLGVTPVGLYDVTAEASVPPNPLPAAYGENVSREVEAALRRTPGVIQIARSELLPFSGEAPPRLISAKQHNGGRFQLDSGAFEVLGLRLVAGRTFTSAEEQGKQAVVVLSETAARQAWPGARPNEVIGRDWQPDGDTAHVVVGVVKDMKTSYGLTNTTPNFALVPVGSEPGPQYSHIVVRTAGRAPSAEVVRMLLQPALGSVKVTVSSAAEAADRSVIEPRFRAGLFLVMGVTGVLLLIAGLCATAGAEVAERRFETGLRLALGATAASVSRQVLARVLAPIAVGAAIGLTGAFWVARLIDSYLYRVDTRDPWSYAIVVSALVAAATVSAWPSARRAANTDPAVVLRAQ